MRVELRITVPGRPVHERGRRHPVEIRCRSPSTCWRVAPARRSRKSSATATASTWAIDATDATSGEANAHNSDTDFGAENVTSNAVTVRRRRR